MEIYSIGFTQKTAAEFFGALRANGIRRHKSLFPNGAPETLLTVSLSEEFERFHYKLAAGVLLKPTSASNDRAMPPHLGLRAPMATHSHATAALSSQR
jgi:hypothetical protein